MNDFFTRLFFLRLPVFVQRASMIESFIMIRSVSEKHEKNSYR